MRGYYPSAAVAAYAILVINFLLGVGAGLLLASALGWWL